MELLLTSELHVYGGNVVFSLPLISPWKPLAFLIFSPPLYNFYVFPSNEKGLRCFFFIISHSSSFPVIHVNLDIQISSKERLGFFVVVDFLSL